MAYVRKTTSLPAASKKKNSGDICSLDTSNYIPNILQIEIQIHS